MLRLEPKMTETIAQQPDFNVNVYKEDSEDYVVAEFSDGSVQRIPVLTMVDWYYRFREMVVSAGIAEQTDEMVYQLQENGQFSFVFILIFVCVCVCLCVCVCVCVCLNTFQDTCFASDISSADGH